MITEKPRSTTLSIDTCYHESGHCVAALVVGFDLIEGVVYEDGNSGSTHYKYNQYTSIEDRLVALLAGSVAHQGFTEKASTSLRKFQSPGDSLLIGKCLKECSRGGEKRTYMNAKKRAVTLIEDYWDVVGQVANKLYTNHRVTGATAEKVLTYLH